MIRNWAKMLPYWVIMRFVKNFCSDIINSRELGQCRGFRISKGEWVIFSEDNYKAILENERLSREIDKEIEEEKEKEQYERLKEKFNKSEVSE